MTRTLTSGSKRFVLPVRVYFQDTDAGGVVFHGTYLNFLERARTEWLRGFGVELKAWTDEHKLLFIVRRLEVAYRMPARLDDLLDVSAELAELGRVQFTLKQQVMRSDELLVDASVNLACVRSNDLRPAPMPQALRTRIAPLWSDPRIQESK